MWSGKKVIFAAYYCEWRAKDRKHKFTNAYECLPLWYDLIRAREPDVPIVIIDSNSPKGFTPEENLRKHGVDVAVAPAKWLGKFTTDVGVLKYPDNLPKGMGSVARYGGGPRAEMRGLHYALENKFDYAVHIEGDVLVTCMEGVSWFDYLIRIMLQNDKRVLSRYPGFGVVGKCMETGFYVVSTDWIRDSNIIRWYAKVKRERSMGQKERFEDWMCKMAGTDYFEANEFISMPRIGIDFNFPVSTLTHAMEDKLVPFFNKKCQHLGKPVETYFGSIF